MPLVSKMDLNDFMFTTFPFQDAKLLFDELLVSYTINRDL